MATNKYGVVQKNWLTAFILSLFFGLLGVDRFYLGKAGTGVLKLLTFGGFGIWALIDFVLIATKSMKGVEWVSGDSKKDKNTAWIIFGVAVVIGLLVVSGAGGGSSSGSNSGETSKSSTPNKAAEKQYKFNDRADKQPEDIEVIVGESATIDGVKMTIQSAVYKNSLSDYETAESGKKYLIANVKIENNSTKTQSYNPLYFRVQTAGGQVLDTTYGTVPNQLNSGDLVAGGSVLGAVVFTVPIEEGFQYIIWKPNGFDAARAIIQVK